MPVVTDKHNGEFAMRNAIILLSLLLLIGSIPAAGATSQEKETDKAVRYTETLERDPLGKDALDMRKWLMNWLIETPDYHVLACDTLGLTPDENIPYSGEILVQQMFGNVAFQIKNPGKRDQASLQLAGVESALRTYTVIVAKDPKARRTTFDMLLDKQKQGKLKEHMEPIIGKKCSGKAKS